MTSQKDICALVENRHECPSLQNTGTVGIEASSKKHNTKSYVVENDGHNPKNNFKKGPWTVEEDALLIEYVKIHGERHWNSVQKMGLMRCGKSCRLRWTNHLRPNLKKGTFSPEEEKIVLDLHAKLGNKWSKIASELSGRTDNEVKNFWNTKIKRRMKKNQLIFQQQKSPNIQGWQELASMPVSIHNSHSFTSPTLSSIVKPQHRGKSEDNLTRFTQFHDPILSFLNNPAYNYGFLSEEENGGKSYSYLPRCELPQHSSVSSTFIRDYSHPHLIPFGIGSTSQVHYQQMPIMASSFECGVNDSLFSSYNMGNNLEVENSSITQEEKKMGNKRPLMVNYHDDYNNGTRTKKSKLEEFLPMDDDLFTLLHEFSSIGSPIHVCYTGNDVCSRDKEAFGSPCRNTIACESVIPATIVPSTFDFNYDIDE